MFTYMLRATLIPILIFLFCFRSFGQLSISVSHHEAAEAFNKGNYDHALNLWNQLYQAGNNDPDLLLNIGHAYAMLDSTALAILFYEKALRFKPASGEIQTAIKNERNRMSDAVAPLNQFFLIRWIKSFLLIFRPGIWAFMGLLLLLIALVSWFNSIGVLKNKLFPLQLNTWMVAVPGIIFLMIAIFAYKQIYRADEAIIFSPCESRQGPSVQSPLVRALYPGEKVILTDTINEWYRINLLNLDEAWIRKECVVIVDPHSSLPKRN